MDAGAVVATAGAEADTAQYERQAKKGTYFDTAPQTQAPPRTSTTGPGPGEPSGRHVVPGRPKGSALVAWYALLPQ